jgi:hypothetical protein
VSISPTSLRPAFTQEDPRSVKIQSSGQYLFALLGYVHVKVLNKMLMKSTPGVNFTKILHLPFVLIFLHKKL